MYAKLLGIIGLLLTLGGCCVCFIPCGDRWFGIGVAPPGVEIQQRMEDPEEQKKDEQP